MRDHAERFSADVLIASDGPRVRPDRPTMSLGCRGAVNVDLVVDLREGAHHSGNWGGLLANPAIIVAHAIASIVSETGEIRIPKLKPRAIPPAELERADLIVMTEAAVENDPVAAQSHGANFHAGSAAHSQALDIVSTGNAETPLTDGITPLLTLDVWEHAYYLKYQNNRGAFVDSIFDIIHWRDVEKRYGQVSSLVLK